MNVAYNVGQAKQKSYNIQITQEREGKKKRNYYRKTKIRSEFPSRNQTLELWIMVRMIYKIKQELGKG